MKRLLIIMLFLLLALTGCAGTEKYNPTTDFVLTTNNFCEALRWKDFFGASRYVVPAAQEEFLAQFEEDPDLFVVDSRVKKIDLEKKENGAEVVYEMEYYHLPSSRVRTWTWTQEWILIREKTLKQGVWLIEKAPPEVPWKK